MSEARAAAEEYTARGWAIVPVAKGAKNPQINDWPKIEFRPEQINGCNVGVKLGWVSGHLTDIDLDSPAAIELAPYFLPETLTFGRASKPASHWLYTCEGIRSAKLIFGQKGEMELVEIRSTNSSNDDCGHQSVFPGSIHESGEAVEFDADCLSEPVQLEAGDLRWRVARLAVAATILRDWTPGSSRHEKTLGLAAFLLQQGWTADETWHCLESVRLAAGDTRKENADFEQDVKTTIRAFSEGRQVAGVSALEACGVDPLTISQLRKHSRTPETLAKEAKLMNLSFAHHIREQNIVEAREVDGIITAQELVAKHASAAELTEAEREAQDPLDRLGTRVDLAAPIEPLDWRVDDVFAPGKVSVIVARPEGGKSPLALWLALCVATGAPVFETRLDAGTIIPHWRTKQCTTLYLDFETGQLAVERAQRMCNALGEDRAEVPLHFVHAEEVLDVPVLEDIESAVLKHAIGCIVIDTYASALPGDIEQSSSQFAHYLRELGKLSRRHSVTVIVLMHAKKGESASIEAMSGNFGAAGAAQTIVHLLPAPDEADGPIEVICARHPRKKWPPFHIQWEDIPTAAHHPEAHATGFEGESVRGVSWGLWPQRVAESTNTGNPANDRRAAKANARAAVNARPTLVGWMQTAPGDFCRKDVIGLFAVLKLGSRELGRAFDQIEQDGYLEQTRLKGRGVYFRYVGP